ncbi:MULTISPECIES: beta-galactosidase BgaS [Oceanotoga]|jgi:beta-galactosidase|uniref:beta-galactosidase BgaS n=1 Tax=Oceanotoga TaxID=1255275 RepID=UPI00264C26F1|nr:MULTISPECIES: beta-galactosidase BgaS [Oceanotoga]MDN5341144.1 beta-galactosidase [Oceanotoga sp.]MDO7976826.1 glycoside hydrolase family 1 protein [Oceanotoga teriensis]
MYKFEKDFLWGFSISGFQFEMGDKSGKYIDKNTDWYKWVNNSLNIENGIVSGDKPEDGPDYFNYYEEDHSYMKKMGCNILRLGVEWSRIFKESTKDIKVDILREKKDIIDIKITEETIKELKKIADKKAIEDYKNIMNDAKNKGMKIFLNLWHFTLPLWIHDPIKVNNLRQGPFGWVDEDTIIEFVKYAAFMAYEFDEIVDYWSTENEPQVVSSLGYLNCMAGFPPAIMNELYYIKALKNQAQAHARAYDSMKNYTKKPIGLIYAFTWATTLDENKSICDEAMYKSAYYFMDMITKGVYKENFEDEKRYRKDLEKRCDFIGINYYSRTMFEKTSHDIKSISGYGQSCVGMSKSKDNRPVSDIGWEIYPEGLKELLLALKERYNKPMIITENGLSDEEDISRKNYLISHLIMMNEAIKEGADVFGYLHWSYSDNYEWAKGLNKRFGIISIDFKTKKRTPRPSYYIFKEIIKNNEIPDDMIDFAKFPYNYLK